MHGVIEWPLDFQWNGHSFLRINRMGPRSLSVPLSFRLSVSCACTLTLCHPTFSSLSFILSLPFSPSRYILFYFLPWLCRRLYCNATEASLCAILATTMCEAIVISYSVSLRAIPIRIQNRKQKHRPLSGRFSRILFCQDHFLRIQKQKQGCTCTSHILMRDYL